MFSGCLISCWFLNPFLVPENKRKLIVFPFRLVDSVLFLNIKYTFSPFIYCNLFFWLLVQQTTKIYIFHISKNNSWPKVHFKSISFPVLPIHLCYMKWRQHQRQDERVVRDRQRWRAGVRERQSRDATQTIALPQEIPKRRFHHGRRWLGKAALQCLPVWYVAHIVTSPLSFLKTIIVHSFSHTHQVFGWESEGIQCFFMSLLRTRKDVIQGGP